MGSFSRICPPPPLPALPELGPTISHLPQDVRTLPCFPLPLGLTLLQATSHSPPERPLSMQPAGPLPLPPFLSHEEGTPGQVSIHEPWAGCTVPGRGSESWPDVEGRWYPHTSPYKGQDECLYSGPYPSGKLGKSSGQRLSELLVAQCLTGPNSRFKDLPSEC